jgi:hypothetical protein
LAKVRASVEEADLEGPYCGRHIILHLLNPQVTTLPGG